MDCQGFVSRSTIRGNYPRMNTQKLAIISLRLASFSSRGDLTTITLEYLWPYFGSDLMHFEVVIDINPKNKKSIISHQRTLAKIVGELER